MAGTPVKKAPASKTVKKTTTAKKPAVVAVEKEAEVEIVKEDVTPVVVADETPVEAVEEVAVEVANDETVIAEAEEPVKAVSKSGNPKECGTCKYKFGKNSCGCCVIFQKLKK